jgi:hypothetical protein
MSLWLKGGVLLLVALGSPNYGKVPLQLELSYMTGGALG